MLIDEVLKGKSETLDVIKTLSRNCSTFLEQSDGRPLYRNLPDHYKDFHKVKARFRKKTDKVVETFNQAFEKELPKLHSRAIFTNGHLVEAQKDFDSFFVFPIDGFKFMYNGVVANSSQEHQDSFDKIFEQFQQQEAERILSDLLNYSYITQNLVEGIDSGAEVIIYNIPYYYALRCSTTDYDELLTYF